MIKVSNDTTVKGSLVVNEAKKHIGCPYKWGADGPFNFDSYGFVRYVYKRALNLSLPKDPFSLTKVSVNISKEDILPGDLILSLNGDHISIYIGNNEIIHSPCHGKKVKISPMFDFFMAKRVY